MVSATCADDVFEFKMLLTLPVSDEFRIDGDDKDEMLNTPPVAVAVTRIRWFVHTAIVRHVRSRKNALLVGAPTGEHDFEDGGDQRFSFLWGGIGTRHLCGHHRLQSFSVERTGETFGLFLS